MVVVNYLIGKDYCGFQRLYTTDRHVGRGAGKVVYSWRTV